VNEQGNFKPIRDKAGDALSRDRRSQVRSGRNLEEVSDAHPITIGGEIMDSPAQQINLLVRRCRGEPWTARKGTPQCGSLKGMKQDDRGGVSFFTWSGEAKKG